MSAQNRAANLVVPAGGDIAVFTTSTTDVITTLSATGHLGTMTMTGNYLTMVAEGGDVYCFFKHTGDDASAAGTVTRTTVAGATRCWLLKDGIPQHFRLTKEPVSKSFRTRFHHVCTAAAKKVRCYVSSQIGTEGIAR